MAKPKHAFASYRTATFISLLVGYMGYYLCRQNFSVAYGPMKEAVGLDALTYGEITSVGTLIYALGKFTTGALADSRGGKLVFFIGLVCSAIASIVFGLGSGVAFFFVLWGLNRFFQSMGWGGLVNVMAQWFPPKHHGTAMGIMSVSYQFGGVLALSFAGLLLSLGAGWRGVFLYPGITLLVLGLILYPFLKGSPREVGYELPEDDGKKHRHVPSDEHLDYWSRFRRVFSDRLFIVMCGLSFILTFLREIFGTWMPAYFTDLGAQASVAAFKSTLFPLLGCLGTLFAGWFSDRYLQARRGPVMAVSLAGLAVVL
ncbi:MAG: MFS transporter, partial [Bdellovibrionota bacterium]